MHFGVWIVPTERFGALGKKERIILAPNCEQRRTVSAEIRLELRVQRHVACVVEKQVELNLVVAATRQQGTVEPIGFGRNQRCVGDAVEILRLGCLLGEKILQSSTVGLRRVLPVFLDGVPALAQTLLVGVAVLGNDRRDPLRMCKCEAKADGGSVIEYVNSIAVEADCLREAVDDIGEVLERGSEMLAAGRF